jgi:hypothetical protein
MESADRQFYQPRRQSGSRTLSPALQQASSTPILLVKPWFWLGIPLLANEYSVLGNN